MRYQKFRVFALVIVVICLWTVSAEAQGNWRPGDFGSWRFFMGISEPRCDSQFWDDYFLDFNGSPSDLSDLVFGTDYLWRTSRDGGVLFGVSFYEGKSTLAYRDWVDADGQDVSHTASLGLSDLTAAYVLRFGRSSVRPYIGGRRRYVVVAISRGGVLHRFFRRRKPAHLFRKLSCGRLDVGALRPRWTGFSAQSQLEFLLRGSLPLVRRRAQ